MEQAQSSRVKPRQGTDEVHATRETAGEITAPYWDGRCEKASGDADSVSVASRARLESTDSEASMLFTHGCLCRFWWWHSGVASEHRGVTISKARGCRGVQEQIRSSCDVAKRRWKRERARNEVRGMRRYLG